MKKFLALLLALTMLVAFAGCEEKPVETEPKATEETLPEGIMTHAEFDAAAMDSEVAVHTYVQAVESWWDGCCQIYAQSKDGAYYIYDYACTEEEAAKLVPGTKIEVKGYKSEWSGEVEITDATITILEGSWTVEAAANVTALMGTDDLAKHMNELVAVKGLTVAASTDADGNEVPFLYKWDGSGSQGDDIYFNVELNGTVYTFTVNAYMIGIDDTYKAVEGLKIGDKIDVEGFLYWYNAPQPHVTSVKVAG